ncbi:MAG: hypothetical protein COW73_06565 [Nitrospirae bacterium CG18_big_fil_WC_8_21_14_2_50_70_55]|nr:ATP synthase F0 subunit B [Deltaproteobacteria bacterium]OIP63332.1 MAG: hypothetical protein AUK30_08620 [Nitrospirae bacterium CG2_30_70_394]PIQ05070.1 MAG: hypothetical protein COW73_06565 [Nitrospirae bacterium CG18_big_fil_WC_8_21_14_2_50_70_55]PIU78977.1 MAG: hypothetical protein COS73_05595 [Nitrospirae bacterium CG06_land_8_20_14_3_00_70_43]PIW83015.1 MAG: hypothetical protein COZ96_05655 [Nitrospirae bacterium CG_4_8_14_3_um_filter_70_85]PIX82171.1 MAG: hypothetical protein COZ33_1
MIELNASLFIQAVNFLVLLGVLNWVLYRPILRALEERRRKTAGARGQVESVEEQGAELMAAYEADLAVARAQARSRYQAHRDQAVSAAEAAVAQAKAKAEAEWARHAEELARRRQELEAELAASEAVLAREIAAKALGRAV